MNILKKTAFSLIPLLLFALMAELAIRVYFYQKHGPYSTGISALYHQLVSWKERRYADAKQIPPLFQRDPVVGYKSVPGVHELVFERGRQTLKAKVTIGKDGYRVTSPDPERYVGKPEIWIFGCSFTYGWGLNDQDTYSWLLQKRFPGWRVRNLGQPGYGNLQALLQLEHAVSAGERLPAIALFVYNPFHRERNAGAYSFLSRMTGHGTADYSYPIAAINEAGLVDVQWVYLHTAGKPRPDPEDWYDIAVTKPIFYRLWTLCSSHHIRPIFGLQSGTTNDPIAQYAKHRGFTVINFSVDLREDSGRKYQNLPFDTHPNRLANLEYAHKLIPELLEATSGFEPPEGIRADASRH